MSFVALKCPSCGADIEFDASKDVGYCNYCGSKIVRKKKIVEHRGSVKIDHSDEISKLYIRAYDMEKDHDYEKALDYYNKILDIDPYSERARKRIDEIKHSVSETGFVKIVEGEPRKSKGVAIMLCLLLGFLGAHEFYLEKPGLGILCIVSSILFMVFIVASYALATFVFIVYIVVLLIRMASIVASDDPMFHPQ